MDTSDIFNVSALAAAFQQQERRPTHIEIAKERLQKVPYYDCILALRSLTTEMSP